MISYDCQMKQILPRPFQNRTKEMEKNHEKYH